MNIIKSPSPNFNTGRNWKRVKKIVVHWIGAGTAESAVRWLTNPSTQVSAHYVVSDDTVWQLVEEKDTAWHAGNLAVNRESIGIEHDATPHRAASSKTYETSAALIRKISKQYNIPLDRDHIIGHKTVVPTQCPGTMDIDRLIRLAEGESDDDKECIEELIEMRASRDKWKEAHREDTEKLSAEIGEKIKTIEAQQKQVSTLNESLTLALGDKKTLLEEKSLLETSLESQRGISEVLAARLENLTEQAQEEYNKCQEKKLELETKIKELKEKLKQKGVNPVSNKQALIEAIKEPLRLLILAIIPVAIVYFQELPYEWAALATLILRFVDKVVHELGKAKENDNLIKGLTRF